MFFFFFFVILHYFLQELLSISDDASLEELVNILFMSCGSVSSTRKYLQTGTIPSGENIHAKRGKKYQFYSEFNFKTM